jgi:hypothetical protein
MSMSMYTQYFVIKESVSFIVKSITVGITH